jgi:hypothetical protein
MRYTAQQMIKLPEQKKVMFFCCDEDEITY